jgi:hypothetical protein
MKSFSFLDHPKFGRIGRDREPNVCPHCAHRVTPEELDWSVAGFEQDQLECVFKCPNVECGHLFIATYRAMPQDPSTDADRLGVALGFSRGRFNLVATWPIQIPKTDFSTEIAQVSSSFVDIYHQAEEAEARGLLQVCGLGYRKSVEFLIKDYCSGEHPSDEEEIKKLPLAQCISKYLHDSRIQASASRAAWLGNDEAHYVRKWAGKDISDLKVLIKLTCNWIESAILTKQYQDEMPRQ